MKKKTRLSLIAAAASLGILLAAGSTAAYLTDRQIRTNVITIGSVSVELDEGGYTDSQIIVPGQKLEKAPKLTNNGSRDEFVFLKVTVPKAKVTLLNEKGFNDEGKPANNTEPKVHQLFKLLADDSGGLAVSEASDTDDGKDVHYHCGTDSSAGWVLLDSNMTGTTEDSYVFGYNKRLAPNESTSTLFDEVQLKSIIDTEGIIEGSGAHGITVKPYGIQADKLEIAGTENTYLTAAVLKEVYSAAETKGGGSP